MCRPQFKNLWFLWLRHTECACYFIEIHKITASQSVSDGREKLQGFSHHLLARTERTEGSKTQAREIVLPNETQGTASCAS